MQIVTKTEFIQKINKTDKPLDNLTKNKEANDSNKIF
jgi:hypothetical protein